MIGQSSINSVTSCPLFQDKASTTDSSVISALQFLTVRVYHTKAWNSSYTQLKNEKSISRPRVTSSPQAKPRPQNLTTPPSNAHVERIRTPSADLAPLIAHREQQQMCAVTQKLQSNNPTSQEEKPLRSCLSQARPESMRDVNAYFQKRGKEDRHTLSRVPSYKSASGRRKPLEIISESCDSTFRIETRRVSFYHEPKTTTTYSEEQYDRTPAPSIAVDARSLYIELVRFKLTEMKLHVDSVNSINLHMANGDQRDLDARKAIIRGVLAANWIPSGSR